MGKQIKEEMHSKGYKMHFWYDDGRLDAICIARMSGEDVVLQKVYKEEEIAEVLFRHFMGN